MSMCIGMNFYNLWIIFVILRIFTGSLWVLSSKIRRENAWPDEFKHPKILIVYSFPFLTLLIVAIFTPIRLGNLFYIGLMLLIIAGIIYVLAIIAFIKSKKGMNMIGIYKYSRNPMYVTMFLFFIGFIFMTWQVNQIMGILTIFITLISAFAFHWIVLSEERFLIKKYGDAYRKYTDKTPRYWGLPKDD